MKKAVVAILMILACALVFVSCDTKDDVTYYQESVVGKYGDGISLTGIVVPETAPVEYVDLPRVEKSIYFDTRIEGWHFSGVYVVKGEEITVTLPEDKADGSITATVGRYYASSYSIQLSSATTTFVSPVSGLLDFNLGNCYGDDFWQLCVSGGVNASYYRLGLDRVADWENSVGYAVADSSNIRIYLPAEYLDASLDVEKAATWWRSLCEYFDKYMTGVFGADKLTPTDVFVVNYVNAPVYYAEKDLLLLPVSYADKILDYDVLSGGGAWEIMLALAKGKAEYAGLNDAALSDVAQIAAAGAFVTLTDGILSAESGSEYWINNAYDCLSMSIGGGLESYGDLAAYVNLIHSFGEEKVVNAAVGYAERGEDDGVSLAQYFCNEFAKDGTDLSAYFTEVFGIGTVSAQSGLTAYVPVQSKYASGCTAASDKTGVTVNSGEKVTFDFAEEYVTTAENATLVKVMLGDSEWKAGEDGLYAFRPDDFEKTKDFTLVFEVDGQTTELSGRFTCNIEVSVFTRYENVPWRDMKTAVKEYAENGSQYLVEEKAQSKAEIPQNEVVDDGVYTFSVNRGAIQVEETATYVIYVRSKGVIRVDFGVPEYMFTMFENPITVNDYTEELCYEIELQQGVSYYYDMYVLATKGNAYGCLGISKKDGEITDIDQEYLIYHTFDKEDVSDYEAPALAPESFGVSKEGMRYYEESGAVLTEYPQAENGSYPASATDGNDDTSFTSKAAQSQVYLFEYQQAVETEFVVIKTGLTGIDYKVEYSADGETFIQCDAGSVYKNINVLFPKAVTVKSVRLTLSSDNEFAGVIKDIYCGRYANEATIVPSNSSRVLYQGKWQYKTGGISVNGWILESYGDDAAIEFNFYGTGISVYCAKGEVYGSMQILVDGKQYGSVELNNPTTLYNCNVFSVEFKSAGKHTIRIVPASNDDIINLDYFTVLYAEQQEAAPETGNLWYFAIIPAALLVIFAICAALDIADRRNKKHKKAQAATQTSGSETEQGDNAEDGSDS